MKCLSIFLFCLPLITLAQNKPLVIEGAAPGFYLNHLVAPKENYYSIGRLYNISPKEIAPFNNLQMESGLSPQQIIKIPLLPNNFTQSATAAADEALVPVYHTVQGKETLYRVSVNYNKIPVDIIKQWNHLKADDLSNGTGLIVGYLKVKKELSALASMEIATTVNEDTIAGPNKKATVKDIAENNKSKRIQPAAKTKTKEKKHAEEAIKKDTAQTNNTEPEIVKPGPPNFDGGVFKTDYDIQISGKELTSETGVGAIFKSTSGWQDGKYYCLYNSAPSGTIIKITSVITNRSVYAKILDTIPDIDQNSGMLIQVSAAAAAELGVDENKFTCTLSFYK